MNFLWFTKDCADQLIPLSRLISRLLLMACLSTLCQCAFGQQPPSTGLPPFGTFNRDAIDTVNVANLNVHFAFPVFSKKGAGLDFYANLVGDSTLIQEVYQSYQYIWLLSPKPGWSLKTPVDGFGQYTPTGATCVQGNQQLNAVTLSNFLYIDANNSVHKFTLNHILIGSTPCYYHADTGTSIDGYTISVACDPNSGALTNLAVTDPAGNVIYPGATKSDPNGNTISHTSYPAQNWTDTTGNVALSSSTNGLSTTYTYPNPSGGTGESVSVTQSNFTVQTKFGCGLFKDLNQQNVPLTTSITLPDTTSYTIVYESTNGTYPSTVVTSRIHSLTLPSGATITYIYSGGTNGVDCHDGGPAVLTKQTPDGTWVYSRSWAQTGTYTGLSTTVVTDPSGNDTVYTFGTSYDSSTGLAPTTLETQRLSYQGPHTSGTLLRTVVTCYNNNFTNCATTAAYTPVTKKDVYTTPAGMSSSALVETQYDVYGNLIYEAMYDYGASTPAVKTTISYGSDVNGACNAVGNNIINYPCFISTYDGKTGALLSQTSFTYDSKGNQTNKYAYTSSAKSLNSSATYNANGTLATSTDVNGAVISYASYMCNGVFSSQSNLPLGFTTSSTWDCNGGVVTSTTDPNGKTTNYAYSGDPFWRIVGITDPTNAALSVYYNFFLPGSGNAFVDSYIILNGGSAETDNVKYLDTLGRVSEVQHRQAPLTDVYDTIAYTYDGNGRQNSMSIPCVASGDEGATCSSATTSQTYDALDRPLLTTDGGGGTVSNTYSGRDVLSVASSPNISKQYEYDGLGRVISVCEISATLPGVGTCKQDTSKTGYWTRYQYDALGNLTGVCQNTAQPYSVDCVASPSAGQQTRKFTYDGLRRMTSESNPESGLKQYFYDSAPSTPGVACPGSYNGDLVKVYDANGNTICFTYDGLYRLASTTYFGPNSNGINRYLVYDSATVNGAVMQNTKGRLAEAYTAATQGGTKTTDEGFSYSVRGDLTDVYESTPHSGGYYHTTVSYFENGVVKTLAGVPGQTGITYGVDTEGRQATAKQGSTNLVTGTTFNAASQPLTVTLGQGDTDNYVYYPTTGLMKTYTFTVGATPKSMAGTLTWNTNGSLSNLAVTDGFNAGGTQTCKYGDPPNNIPGYDDLGRLIKVDCGASIWQQNFSYDAFGNITKAVPTGGTGIAWNPGYNGANNHYTLTGTSYDANGDLLTDTFHTYGWDGDGHTVTVDSSACGTNGTCLTYDALGRVVEKNVAGAYTEILYSPMGKLAVMNGQTLVNGYFPLPGGATYNVAPGYARLWHKDWLGTVRLSTTLSNRTVDYDRSFAPFGERYINFGSTANNNFTGDTQDTIAGTFDTENRELNPSQGRWLSPDPRGLNAAIPLVPQSWNQYAYVLNHPLNDTDPLGLWCVWDDGTGHDPPPFEGGIDSTGCIRQGGHWDPYDTITNVFQLDGIVTQIQTTSGKTFDYGPISGMTLEGLDQTLNSYSVLGQNPDNGLNPQSFINSLNLPPIHVSIGTPVAPPAKPLTATEIYSCIWSPEETNDINQLHDRMEAMAAVSPGDEGHPEPPEDNFMPNIQKNAQPKKSAGNVATAFVAIENEEGKAKGAGAAFGMMRAAQTAECFATNR
jgi:RHS repeat-associated protein